MKKINFCITQSSYIKKNNDGKYIVNYLIESNDLEQHVIILCMDEDDNTVEQVFQLDNKTFYGVDCTEFMTICNPKNKTSKRIKYRVYSLQNPEDYDNRDFETHGSFTLAAF